MTSSPQKLGCLEKCQQAISSRSETETYL